MPANALVEPSVECQLLNVGTGSDFFRRIESRGATVNNWAGVILAGGNGERMKSRIPKPLHRVCGKELVRYPVELLAELGIDRIVVVVSPANRDAIRDVLGDSVEYVVQPQPGGTGEALRLAAESLPEEVQRLLVQGADAPLARAEVVRRQMEAHQAGGNRMTCLSAKTSAPGDLGRVQRDSAGWVTAIVESRDLQDIDDTNGAAAEVNAGIYCFDSRWLRENLSRIEPSPGGEVYLTAIAAMGAEQGDRVDSVLADDPEDILAVNDRLQLAQVEAVQRRRICERWMMAGVTITDPASVYIDANVAIGQDTVIMPNTMLLGGSRVGEDCEIGPNTTVRDSLVGDRCRVTASALEGATLESDVRMGPFCHLRPGAYLERNVYLGNYVEVKESRFAQGAVMGHFGFIGDASVGARSNLGAGLITCNYDGVDKHRTNIGEDSFIGCDTMLVAPVSVGDGAATGAGAVVTRDIPAGLLAVGVPARITREKTKSN